MGLPNFFSDSVKMHGRVGKACVNQRWVFANRSTVAERSVVRRRGNNKWPKTRLDLSLLDTVLLVYE